MTGCVQATDLEGACGDELRLDGVGEEEDHEARVHLVLDQPGVPA